MKTLPAPVMEAETVLLACAATIADPNLRRRVRRQRNRVTQAERIYRQRGGNATLYRIAGTDDVGTVTGDEMVWVYDNKLSRKKDAARHHYDTLLQSVPHNTCPFCSQRKIRTLDHYLAKTTHPVYAVTPLNLVPSCSDCNKSKLAHVPEAAEEQVMHPYFDSADTARWLVATVVQGKPPGVTFAVREPPTWSAIKQARIKKHFDLLGLEELYASHAGSRLANLKFSLEEEFADGGAVAVCRFLKREAASARRVLRNSWEAAMFRALAESAWFCRHGHTHLV